MKNIYKEIKKYIKEENLKPLSKDEFGMAIAIFVSEMSEDPNTKVGSCIIDENNEILSIGYNEPPFCWKGEFPWERDAEKFGEENTKYPYVIHSEANSLNNYEGSKNKLANSTMYVTLFPCNQCSKQIVQSGIRKVIYKDDKYKDTKDAFLSRILLSRCGVEFIKYDELMDKKEYKLSKKIK